MAHDFGTNENPYEINSLTINNESNTNIVEQFFVKELRPKIVLRSPKSCQPSFLYFEVTYKSKRSRIIIPGCKVIPSQFNKEIMRAYISPILSNLENHNNEIVNSRIDSYLLKFKQFIHYLCESDVNRVKDFHSELKKFMGKKKAAKCKKAETPEDIFEEIRKSAINSNKSDKTIRENYIGKGLAALKAFAQFKADNGEIAITQFSQLTGALFHEFAEYLEQGHYRKSNGEPYSMSSLNSIMRCAVSVVKCLPIKYLPIEQADSIHILSFKNETASDNAIALRDKEILQLWHYTPENKKDEEIRDMFLLLCTLGVRSSDISSAETSIQEIDGIEYLNFAQKKTSGRVKVSFIFELTKEILAKYETLPLVNIKRRINDNIGRIAKAAGITGKELIIRHYQGEDKPREIWVNRHDLIKTHTGRRTFVTMLVLREWPYEKIAKFSGHKNPTTVKKYDKSKDVDFKIFKTTAAQDRLKLVDDEVQDNKVVSVESDANSIIEKRAKTAVEILTSAAHDVGIIIIPKGRTVNLLDISEAFVSKKNEIIATKGEAEYEKIKSALQFGKTPEERDLLGKFFCMAIKSRTFSGMPVKVVNYDKVEAFWQKQEQIEAEEKKNEIEREKERRNNC